MTVSRLLIEGLAHERIDVCTLTYANEHLPEGGSLCAADMVGWRKRLRFRCEALGRLRFFVVGEYGGRFGRPHYHVVIFGADRRSFVNGQSFTSLVHASWARGSVDWSGGWCPAAAAYCCSYIVKGHNVAGHDALGGRVAEFALWPRAPGLGAPGLPVLLPELLGERDARSVVDADGELPFIADVSGRSGPVGSYLMGKMLRDFAGLSDGEVKALNERRMRAKSIAAHDEFLAEVMAEAVSGNAEFVRLLCPTL